MNATTADGAAKGSAGPASAGSPAPAQRAPLAGLALSVTAIALALGTFMQVLDTTIANVSLNTIAGDLGVSQDSSTWVITAFACANGVTVPLTGWLMRRFGIVRTFMVSVILFTITSLLCGLAWSLPSLIAFRLLQGACSGPMIPGSQALLIAVFPPERRSTALAIWAMTTLVGPVAGPVLGGYISDYYHWGWIFLINVPVGAFVAFITWRVLLKRDQPGMKIPIDFVGIILLVLWVGSLQIMLDLGKNADWFNSTFITAMAFVAGIGCIAWLIWESTEARPIVDLSLFKNRNFALGTLALSLGYGTMFGNLVLMPLWLQTQLGYTATWAGLIAAPSGIVAIVLTPIVSRASGWLDARILATLSFLSFGISYWMRSHFTTDVDPHALIMPILVQGVAMSMFFTSCLAISLDGVPSAKVPSASGISNFARITTGSFFASVATTVWDRREALHQTNLSEGAHIDQTLQTMQNIGMSAQQATAGLTRQLIGQAYLLAMDDITAISAVMLALLIGIVWFTRKPAGQTGAVAAD